MRGVLAAALLILVATHLIATHAAAAGWGHQRVQSPIPTPAFATSGGRAANSNDGQGAPASESDLQRFADAIGAGRNGRSTDLFRYSLDRQEVGGPVSGAAIAGAVSNGAAEIQLRWNN